MQQSIKDMLWFITVCSLCLFIGLQQLSHTGAMEERWKENRDNFELYWSITSAQGRQINELQESAVSQAVLIQQLQNLITHELAGK